MDDSYVLVDRIAEGPHAIVWQAEHRGQPVAIKLARHPIDEPRIARELALLKRVDHPHVMPTWSSDTIVMPLGVCTLADLASARPLAAAEVTAVVRAIADALAALHAMGITHNDVKAANIVLDTTGKPWLADFGSAATAATPASMRRDRRALAACALALLPVGSPLHRRLARGADVRTAFASVEARWPTIGLVSRASAPGDPTEDFGTHPSDQRLANRPSRLRWRERVNERVFRLAAEGSTRARRYAARWRQGSTRSAERAMAPKRSGDR